MSATMQNEIRTPRTDLLWWWNDLEGWIGIEHDFYSWVEMKKPMPLWETPAWGLLVVL